MEGAGGGSLRHLAVATFLAVAFFAVAFFVSAFLVAVFLAGVFFAAALLAVALRAVFFAVAFFAAFFAVEVPAVFFLAFAAATCCLPALLASARRFLVVARRLLTAFFALRVVLLTALVALSAVLRARLTTVLAFFTTLLPISLAVSATVSAAWVRESVTPVPLLMGGSSSVCSCCGNRVTGVGQIAQSARHASSRTRVIFPPRRAPSRMRWRPWRAAGSARCPPEAWRSAVAIWLWSQLPVCSGSDGEGAVRAAVIAFLQGVEQVGGGVIPPSYSICCCLTHTLPSSSSKR